MNPLFNISKTLIAIGAVVVLLLVGIYYYNSFVTQTNAVDAQWKQVEVQYQRRYDLIPNLVATVKGAQKQEQTVFGEIAQARQNYANAGTPDQKVAAANQVESSLSRLIAIVESYPDLKSNQTVLALMDELAGTENRISVERRRYNDMVRDYNTKTSTFPGVLFAKVFGFQTKQYFNSSAGSQNAPTVQF